jgi:hypothetical protein
VINNNPEIARWPLFITNTAIIIRGNAMQSEIEWRLIFFKIFFLK